jgi:hypothetical protein
MKNLFDDFTGKNETFTRIMLIAGWQGNFRFYSRSRLNQLEWTSSWSYEPLDIMNASITNEKNYNAMLGNSRF